MNDVSARKWEKAAQSDAYGYIMGYAGADPEVFWKSGEAAVTRELVPLLDRFNVRRDLGLELGCGIGRLLFPAARLFSQVVGVDISNEMVRRARALAIEHGILNARFVATAHPDGLVTSLSELAGKVNFVFSLMVFQHVEDIRDIDGYLRAIRLLLSDDGVGYLQFDTRVQSLPYRLRTAAPDFFLPRFWRRGVRRVRHRGSEIAASLEQNGLKVLEERAPGSSYHCYIVGCAQEATS